jgi:hypothetical protein
VKRTSYTPRLAAGISPAAVVARTMCVDAAPRGEAKDFEIHGLTIP